MGYLFVLGLVAISGILCFGKAVSWALVWVADKVSKIIEDHKEDKPKETEPL